MGVFSIFKRKKKTFDFYIAGIGYKSDAVKSIVEISPRYAKPSGVNRVYKYKQLEAPCTLVPEPKNPADKNAIMVVCGGVCVGYVPADMCLSIKKLIKKYDASLKIRGGRYKQFDPEDNDWITEDGGFSGTVYMTER